MSEPHRPERALLRRPSASMDGCLQEVPAPLDMERLQAQHAAYAEALRAAGVAVDVLEPDDALPDSCFVEDAAVVLGAHALATRPGAPSRRPEVAAVAERLAPLRHVLTCASPAALEGGDVMRVDETLFVGHSRRSNAAGIERLAEVAALEGLAVVAVPIPGLMHLKGVVSVAGHDLLVYDPGQLDPAPFTERGLRCLPADEHVGANVLCLGDVVLVPAEAPRTADRLEREGLVVVPVPGSEFHKADGRLTCLSLRLSAPGTWCC